MRRAVVPCHFKKNNIPPMLIYIILILIMLFAMLFPSDRKGTRNTVFIFEILALTLVCGMSDMMGGYDRYIYCDVFDSTARDIRHGLDLSTTSAIEQNPTEMGWGIYNILLGYLTPNRYIFILIHTLIVFAILAWHIKRLSKHPEATLFVLMCIFYFFTWTYLRQTLACSIAWFAVPFAIKRRPIQFFAIVALAATFHNSALLFGMVYFVARRQFSQNELFTLFFISLILGLTPLGQVIFDFTGGNINEKKAEVSLAGVDDAPRVAYIVEAAIFLYLIYKGYQYIGQDKTSVCMRNIAFCFIFILTFFVRFSDGGRMSWFFMIGIACTAGEIISKMPKAHFLRYFTILIMLGLFFRIVIGWNIALRPYKSFLTNGVKENDGVWEAFEYDHSYDNDKFYNLK